MCLQSITKTYDRSQKRVRWVWKAFNGTKAHPHFAFFMLNESYVVPQDEWIKAEPDYEALNFAVFDSSALYRTGFHCFLDEKSARAWRAGYAAVVMKVKVRNIRILGVQEGLATIVADEMYVPSIPKKRTKCV